MHRLASTDGVEVVLHDLGGDGPPILFAHATGLHAHVWEPVAASLPDFRCWAIDFRGHGDATAPAGLSFDWHGFGDDVLAAVDGLGLERPFGVGHSKGGAALLLAEEARPGTFAKLWCFDPVVFPTGGRVPGEAGVENPLAASAARRRAVFPSRDDAFANFRSKQPFDVVTDEALHAYVDHGFADQPDGTVALKCAPLDEAQVYRMGAAHDVFANLDRVTLSGDDRPGQGRGRGSGQLRRGHRRRAPRRPAGRLPPLDPLRPARGARRGRGLDQRLLPRWLSRPDGPGERPTLAQVPEPGCSCGNPVATTARRGAMGTAPQRRKPGGARPDGPLLEREQIVKAALELTRRHGLDGMSMRKLGQELGVTSMAIYWYFKGRDELVEAITDSVLGAIELPEADDQPWMERLRLFARAVHDGPRRLPGDRRRAADLPELPAVDGAARRVLGGRAP